jgi:tetratricopeptide (TPR) repeat protein
LIDYAAAFCMRGRCYMYFQEYKRALYDFSAALRADVNGSPSDIADYYMYAGQCNQYLGQYEEALAHYNEGISKNSDSGELYFHRGLAHVSLTNF